MIEKEIIQNFSKMNKMFIHVPKSISKEALEQLLILFDAVDRDDMVRKDHFILEIGVESKNTVYPYNYILCKETGIDWKKGLDIDKFSEKLLRLSAKRLLKYFVEGY